MHARHFNVFRNEHASGVVISAYHDGEWVLGRGTVGKAGHKETMNSGYWVYDLTEPFIANSIFPYEGGPDRGWITLQHLWYSEDPGEKPAGSLG